MTPFLPALMLLATPTFPGVIQAELGATAAPRCSICHASDAGGGPVVQPFGLYLESRGLRPNDESSLRAALQAAAGERHDSSGTGTPDVDALKAGLDPNGARTVRQELVASYGCSSPSGAGGPLALLAGLLLSAVRRRRKPGAARDAR